MTINKKDIRIGILDPMGYNNNPLTNKEYSETYKNLSKIWSKFPAYEDAVNIISKIKKHNVILVVSGTGSGKTVLFPKYVLHAFDYNAKIAITLPKQLITKSAAQFAADTLDVVIGDEVGFQYRNADKNSFGDKTKLLYCTDGTLVARLLADPDLNDFDAYIIDFLLLLNAFFTISLSDLYLLEKYSSVLPLILINSFTISISSFISSVRNSKII